MISTLRWFRHHLTSCEHSVSVEQLVVPPHRDDSSDNALLYEDFTSDSRKTSNPSEWMSSRTSGNGYTGKNPTERRSCTRTDKIGNKQLAMTHGDSDACPHQKWLNLLIVTT
ncbi:hypothetical protein ECG_07264 [Echinococcus granulosus]|uniref:Uncharacterized protein n=1 Tax=Echinococcus granulosus TaxID=6210 RepID=A0A068WTY3_ECHGR|nr:hypothetical protein ECG_07264 [Echinococcus granulosus]CDS21933.1 hypothetical protein EgrG_002022700 [Echinococcus granulosus]